MRDREKTDLAGISFLMLILSNGQVEGGLSLVYSSPSPHLTPSHISLLLLLAETFCGWVKSQVLLRWRSEHRNMVLTHSLPTILGSIRPPMTFLMYLLEPCSITGTLCFPWAVCFSTGLKFPLNVFLSLSLSLISMHYQNLFHLFFLCISSFSSSKSCFFPCSAIKVSLIKQTPYVKYILCGYVEACGGGVWGATRSASLSLSY